MAKIITRSWAEPDHLIYKEPLRSSRALLRAEKTSAECVDEHGGEQEATELRSP